ncbi:MAG: M48 family metallopeptidase [Clostridia bacterium]|nr:M48 family metallopeptidase [Clostridia bacterium]
MKNIKYNDEVISYQLIRSKIKNMYIYIRDGKVIVKVPTRLKEKEIDEFVNRKARWIYEKIKQEKEMLKEEKIKLEDINRLETIVKKTIEKYETLLGEKTNKVRIKNIKYAWGSCSSNRNITINQKLALKDEKVIEYVVLHEMCHLTYMNHSKSFWQLLETYMPQYKEYRKTLQ